MNAVPLPALDPLPRRGDRVVLRRFAANDLERFQRYRADPGLGRYQGWSPMKRRDAATFIDRMRVERLFVPGAWNQIAIADGRTDMLIGDIGLYVADDGRAAEIGFTFARGSHGAGLATEAVRQAIGLLFDQTTVERIVGISDTRNARSIRLLERVGMRALTTRATVFKGESCLETTFCLARDGDGVAGSTGAVDVADDSSHAPV